jgi:hypothetical protein
MDASSLNPEGGRTGPQLPEPGGLAGPGGGIPGVPVDADGEEDVDVLTLTGQVPSDDGEWLLVTAVDGLAGAEFLARHLRRDEQHAHGSDVLARLLPDAGSPEQPVVRAEVWVVLGGHLILAAAWAGLDSGRWPEQIRPAVAFAMGMVTELEEHDADLGIRHRVWLKDADTASIGVPLGITSGRGTAGEHLLA